MALISMAVYDTEENKRSEYTRKTVDSLIRTVDFNRHRLAVVDNNSCKATESVYETLKSWWRYYKLPEENLFIIRLNENVGTARAVNMGWKLRLPGEHCVKMDNDVVIHQKGWLDILESAVRCEPMIGQIGLKRKDCWEYPTHENPELRSKLHLLPHEAGQPWIIVEQAKHIIGTCVLHSADLIDKVGYLYQPGLYGYDDVLMSWRANLAGFICCFLPSVNIDHIDTGTTDYQKWKERAAGEYTKEVSDLVDKYISKEQSLYYEA